MAEGIVAVFDNGRVVDFEDADYYVSEDDHIKLFNEAGEDVAYLDKGYLVYLRVGREHEE